MMIRTGAHSSIDTTLLRLLTQGYEQARARRRSILVSLVRPVDDLDPLDLFGRGRHLESECVYWEQPSDGFALTGIGAAYVITPEGADRFSTAARSWRDLIEDAVVDDASMGVQGTGPLLLGGFSFDPECSSIGAWDSFPDAMLLLPRLLLTQTDSGCWITTNAVLWPDSNPEDEASRLTDDLTRLLDDVEAGTASCPASPDESFDQSTVALPNGGQPREVTPTNIVEIRSASDWQAMVARAARAVRHGALEKVVLAREIQVQSDVAFDVPSALKRLRATYPSCYVFAVGVTYGQQVFLGATPERLVRVDGDEVQATCLAGSIRRGDTPEEDHDLGQQLLNSEKDLIEHGVVVRTLRAGLGGLCDEIHAPEKPSLLSVSNVHHLYTPVTARLMAGATLLDLVAQLHPTPAVGGFPRREAMEFIRDHEDLDRGWYAAPVGWLGRDGTGQFAVALRSALVAGSRASLFAGCGIVADSDPEQEYAESQWKLRPMLEALGGSSDAT